MVFWKTGRLGGGGKYNDLIGKILVFWKTGRLREVVAYERCSDCICKSLYIHKIFTYMQVHWKPLRIMGGSQNTMAVKGIINRGCYYQLGLMKVR